MLSRSDYTIYHIDKERTEKKTQIESINNRKQTIKKTTTKNVQIKLENELEVGVGDDLHS